MDLLVVPFVFAGFGVEGDDRGGEEVFAGAFAPTQGEAFEVEK